MKVREREEKMLLERRQPAAEDRHGGRSSPGERKQVSGEEESN